MSEIDERDRLTLMDHVRGWLSQRRWWVLGRAWRKRRRRRDRDVLLPQLRTKIDYALRIYTNSAWRFPDEWRNEPEAKWYPEYIRGIGVELFGGE